MSLSSAIAKPVTPSLTNSDVTYPHSPTHLNCPVPTVFPEELVHSRFVWFKLSAFASLIKASCYFRKLVVRKTLPAAHVNTFYRILIISLLTLNSKPICKSIFSSAVCTLACASTVGSMQSSIPRKGLGSTTTHQAVSKIKKKKQCNMLYKILKITRQMFRI